MSQDFGTTFEDFDPTTDWSAFRSAKPRHPVELGFLPADTLSELRTLKPTADNWEPNIPPAEHYFLLSALRFCLDAMIRLELEPQLTLSIFRKAGLNLEKPTLSLPNRYAFLNGDLAPPNPISGLCEVLSSEEFDLFEEEEEESCVIVAAAFCLAYRFAAQARPAFPPTTLLCPV
jgi:hypothetical protein